MYINRSLPWCKSADVAAAQCKHTVFALPLCRSIGRSVRSADINRAVVHPLCGIPVLNHTRVAHESVHCRTRMLVKNYWVESHAVHRVSTISGKISSHCCVVIYTACTIEVDSLMSSVRARPRLALHRWRAFWGQDSRRPGLKIEITRLSSSRVTCKPARARAN